MPYRSKCVKCEKNAVNRWSIFNGETAIVAELCGEHGDYLAELVELVGPKPSPATGPIQKQSIRIPKARPLDWTPPS